MDTYTQAWQQSIDDPSAFWGEAAQGIDWYVKPTVVLDDTQAPRYRWFPDGVLNTCFNALDRHIENGRGEQLALIYDSPVTGVIATYTYAEMLDEVSDAAAIDHFPLFGR